MSLWGVSHPFAKARRIAAQFRASPFARAGRGSDEGVAQPRARLKALAAGETAPSTGEIFIYEPIGWDCWSDSGITGKSFGESLDLVKGVKTLNIYVNCEGGDVFEAKAIYSQLARFPAHKVVHIDGIAASAATFIAMAGDKIITSPVGTWMVHEAWSGAMGKAMDLRAVADLLELETQTIAETYARRSGKKVDAMLALMSAPPDGTWMNAAQALEQGFTDEIAEPEPVDEPETESAKNSIRGPAFNALELTQKRIKSLSPAQLLAARTDMHRRNHPGQPGPAKPASR